jgi:D-alanyl-D-alanine-carboxypeptidase/D-alanyl-D-alanine-endopeptidase
MQRRHLLRTLPAGVLGTMPLSARRVHAAQPPWDAMLQERVRHEGMGLALVAADAQGAQWAFAGRRSAADPRPPDAASAFEWGSITKTLVGLLLARMALDQALALDEPVEAALGQPLRDSAGQPLTWADLATHRSGLPRLPENIVPPDAQDPYAAYDTAALEAFLQRWKPALARDVRWEYSNLGYGLLGHALALRARQPLPALLQARVLAPLGLQAAQLALAGGPLPPVLQGHDAQARPVPRWQFGVLAGAGALVGPAQDLLRYGQAAAGLVQTPLAAAFELALQPRAAATGAARIGLGWLRVPVNGRLLAQHDGGTFGFSSSLWVDPERRRTALALANAMVPVNDLALHAMEPAVPPRDVAAEKAQTQRTAAAVEPPALQRLVGTYALNPGFALTLRLREGRLFAQATGQGEFELFALDGQRFFARVTALEIHFEGDSGPAPALVLHQAGQRLRFVRRE